MICPKCNREMKNVLHFDTERNYQFNRCPYCQERTKSKRIHFDTIKERINNSGKESCKA